MKTFFKTSFLAIALLIGVAASAQENPLILGVKAGINLSNFGGDIDDTDAKIGFNVGLTVDYSLAQDVFLLTGLELTTKGAKNTFSMAGFKYESKANPMYLQLPIHAGYRFEIAEGTKINIHAGPYVAYGIGGKTTTKVKGNVSDLSLASEEGKEDFFGKDGADRFDFGLGLGVGAEFGQFGIGLGYDLGLLNISGESDYKIRNMNAYLTVGYKF